MRRSEPTSLLILWAPHTRGVLRSYLLKPDSTRCKRQLEGFRSRGSGEVNEAVRCVLEVLIGTENISKPESLRWASQVTGWTEEEVQWFHGAWRQHEQPWRNRVFVEGPCDVVFLYWYPKEAQDGDGPEAESDGAN